MEINMSEEKKRGRPRVKPVKPKGSGRKGPRPHVWICGPDEYKHSMYTPWMMARAQANFRNEEWDLSFDEYYEIWKEQWSNRGRKADSVCMTRQDWGGPWSKDNVVIVIRKEHLAAQAEARSGLEIKYKSRKNKSTEIEYVKKRIK